MFFKKAVPDNSYEINEISPFKAVKKRLVQQTKKG
jgi:hypothetical protein